MNDVILDVVKAECDVGKN